MINTSFCLSLNIIIPLGHTIKFEQNDTFESFIGQFQGYTNEILWIINGTTLRTGIHDIPDSSILKFDYKIRRMYVTEYHFSNVTDATKYCVFGRDMATIFFPLINDVDPLGKIISPVLSQHNHREVVIVDQGNRLTFSQYDYPVEIKINHYQ
jgi:hypothetical protein